MGCVCCIGGCRMFKNVITLFNRYEDRNDDTCKWYANVLENVELQKITSVTVDKAGNKSADTVKLHIPYSSGYMVGELVYLKPKEWYRRENKDSTITLKTGDFFVEGKLKKGIYDDAEYARGLFSYIHSNYDDVYTISSISSYDVIQHFEVGAN